MASFEEIRDRLPTLYRPDEEDASLFTFFMRAVAAALEDVDRQAGSVLQARWFAYADRALYSSYFARSRQLQGLGPPALDDPALDEFPYVHDLAYLGALLALPPWQVPPALREQVEAYRQRIGRIVALYRNGLGTVDALRRIVEAQLPVDRGQPAGRQDRPFWIEEYAPLVGRSLAVQARGEPVDMVGPLMRWTVSCEGLEPPLPTIYVQGVEPQEGLVDPTGDPVIELYQAGDRFLRLGIAYQGTISPGETLRLRPAYASWIGTEEGLLRAQALPTEEGAADPTAPGPWEAVEGGPAARVVAVHQAQDRTLWVATQADESGALWRYDGRDWLPIPLAGDPRVYCLAEEGQDLWAGTDDGLLQVPLYPGEGESFAGSLVPGSVGQAVYAMYRAADGQRWIGSAAGIMRYTASSGGPGTLEPFVLREDQGTAAEVYAISQDGMGNLYFGTVLGLFQYQPGTGHWYWYEGREHTEQALDWKPFYPDRAGDERGFPGEEQAFLPPVRCVHPAKDASLWLGTDHGIARYVARSVRGLTYETVLEAFPDLTAGQVFAIREDARGLVWFCTDRGLFRYDGRDWWQFQADTWVQLGRADTLYSDPPVPRGAWRFDRASSRWQRFDLLASTWTNYAGDPRTTDEAPVLAVTWTDGVAAELGQWDGASLADPTAVDAAQLAIRYKPDETRIVGGGIPAVPRLPVGTSVWRYLSLEPEGLVEAGDRPSWTIEGRLLPPPEDGAAPGPGRYDVEIPLPPSFFDEAVFAFNPAARVWFAWEARQPLTVLVRLKVRSPGEHIDPAILDRVWQGVQQVRPAGIRAMLAIEEKIVRGKDNG